MPIRMVFAALVLVAWQLPAARGDADDPRPQCHVLVVGGLPGSEVYARRYRDWIGRFHAYFTQAAGVPAANVVVLSGDEKFAAPWVRKGPATVSAVREACAELCARSRPADQFVVVLLGHGASLRTPPGLVLKGPALSASDLAEMLDKIPAKEQVVLNFSAASGPCLKYLAKPGRINLSATSPRESNEPTLAEFFLAALEGNRADGFAAPSPQKDAELKTLAEKAAAEVAAIQKQNDAMPKKTLEQAAALTELMIRPEMCELAKSRAAKAVESGAKDNVVTVLEAYHWATWNAAQWIGRQKTEYRELPGHILVPSDDGWIVTGKESVRLFEKLFSGRPKEPGSAKLDPRTNREGAEVDVLLKPPFGRPTIAGWDQRRILGEHAVLEDRGARRARAALTAWSPPQKEGEMGTEKTPVDEGDLPPLGPDPYDPLDGGFVPLPARAPADPGYRAARTVLGKPGFFTENGRQ